MATIDFDARVVEPMDDFSLIPEGKYSAIITDSEMCDTKSGLGQYLRITFEIIDGEYKGRKLWSRLNLVNPSEIAVKIARSEFAALCRAVGVESPRDSIELHNIPLLVGVKCRKRDDTGEMTNEVKGYYRSSTSTNAAPWNR